MYLLSERDHVGDIDISAFKVNGIDQVWGKYSIILLGFLQSSSVGHDTLVIRYGTAEARFDLNLLSTYSSCAPVYEDFSLTFCQ